MKGWSEEEFRNKDLMAPCGLYCGTCGVYIATRDNNEKFRTVDPCNNQRRVDKLRGFSISPESGGLLP